MIISHIIGGLGNQMFQYAAGRALAEQLKLPLLLDVFDFKNYTLHQGFELSHVFMENQGLATKKNLKQMLGWQSFSIIKKMVLRPNFSFLRNKRLILEPYFQYWTGLSKISQSAYLVGYWQSEKYFKSIESTIRTDFVFKQPMSANNQKIADDIRQNNAVSLHIRRGDYVQNAITNATHGVCSLDYYQQAIKYITVRVTQPKFFIFSDDIEWVKNNLSVAHPCEYITNNQGAESYNDMRLMSLCQHNIIANSSFSWWGAWLNQNHEKIVIAPKRWFYHSADTQDLIPSQWVVI